MARALSVFTTSLRRSSVPQASTNNITLACMAKYTGGVAGAAWTFCTVGGGPSLYGIGIDYTSYHWIFQLPTGTFDSGITATVNVWFPLVLRR